MPLNGDQLILFYFFTYLFKWTFFFLLAAQFLITNLSQ